MLVYVKLGERQKQKTAAGENQTPRQKMLETSSRWGCICREITDYVSGQWPKLIHNSLNVFYCAFVLPVKTKFTLTEDDLSQALLTITAAISSGQSPSRSNLKVTILLLCVCNWHSTTRSPLSETCSGSGRRHNQRSSTVVVHSWCDLCQRWPFPHRNAREFQLPIATDRPLAQGQSMRSNSSDNVQGPEQCSDSTSCWRQHDTQSSDMNPSNNLDIIEAIPRGDANKSSLSMQCQYQQIKLTSNLHLSPRSGKGLHFDHASGCSQQQQGPWINYSNKMTRTPVQNGPMPLSGFNHHSKPSSTEQKLSTTTLSPYVKQRSKD